MKKVSVFISIFVSFLFLSACQFGDVLVDDIAVHNDLVARMDTVLDSEEAFYNVYIDLYEGDDISLLVTNFDTFKTSVDDLDSFFTDTTFSSGQTVFVDEYNDYYKTFVDDYISYAGEFVSALESNGATFDVMDPYLNTLDTFTLDFVTTHNRLIDTINLQSDETSADLSY